MNAARAFYGMTPLAVAGNATDAWADLRYERGATLWLEGRNFTDHRRWFTESGAAKDPAFQGRATCAPIARAERLSNSNLRG
jgi:hypothetical protein